LLYHIHQVSSHESETGMTATSTVNCFTPSIFKAPDTFKMSRDIREIKPILEGFLELLHDREKDYKRDLEDEDQMNEGRKIMLDRVNKLKHKDIDTKSTDSLGKVVRRRTTKKSKNESNKKKRDEILHSNEIKTTPMDTKPVERNLSIPACKFERKIHPPASRLRSSKYPPPKTPQNETVAKSPRSGGRRDREEGGDRRRFLTNCSSEGASSNQAPRSKSQANFRRSAKLRHQVVKRKIPLTTTKTNQKGEKWIITDL